MQQALPTNIQIPRPKDMRVTRSVCRIPGLVLTEKKALQVSGLLHGMHASLKCIRLSFGSLREQF